MDFDDITECVDPSQLFMLLTVLVIAVGAWTVQRVVRRFQRTVESLGGTAGSCGLSGRAVARRLLDACGLPEVGVVRSTSRDRYDAVNREVQLSEENYQGAAISAVAIAAHEVGHAQQYASRMRVTRVAPLVRRAHWVLLVAACALLVLGIMVTSVTDVSLIVVAICVISLTLQTAVILPREIDASRRAKGLAQQAGLLTSPREIDQFDRVLRSAGWTYVASMTYHWLGLIGLSLALLHLGQVESDLRDDEIAYQSELAADAPMIDGVGALEFQMPTTPAAHANAPLPPAPYESAGSSHFDGLPSGAIHAPLESATVPHDPTQDLGYMLLMAAMTVVEWCGLLGIVGVFLVLGWWQRKWTAPQNALKRNQAGLRLFGQGKYEAAVREFTKAIQLDAKLTSGYHNRATANRQLDRQDEALSDFETVLQLHPGQVDALLGRGEIWMQQGDRQRALVDFEEALRLAPECTAALCLRGRLRLDEEDTEAALRDYEQALLLDHEAPLPYWGRGMVSLLRDDHQRAIDDLNAALDRAPEFPPALRDRGLARHLSGDHEGAIIDLDEAIRLAPTDALAWNNRAAAWQKLGEYARARDDLQEALRLAPELPHAYKNLAWLQATSPDAEFRDGSRAVVNATRALELAQWQQPQWLSVLAAAHAESGDYESALKWQQECLAQCSADERPSLQAQWDGYRARQPYRDVPIAAAGAGV